MSTATITDFASIGATDLMVRANNLVVHPYWHLRLEVGEPHLSARPGQFFHLSCPSGPRGTPYLRRPMSVHLIDRSRGEISFLYKVTGLGTEGLTTLKEGDRINVMGPLGVGFSEPPAGSNALILARGVGLATMAPLASLLSGNGVSFTAVCSCRDRLATVGDEVFERYGSVIRVYDTDGSSAPEAVDSLVRDLHADRPLDWVYTCGSNRLIRLLQGLSVELGFGGEVAVEQRMACGLGMCHACVVDVGTSERVESLRVCTDGPVFPLGSIR